MQDTEVYIKTDAGRDEIRSRTIGLPMSVRAILLMVDGQRSVSTMRSLIAGSKAPADVLDGLVAQGLIEPRAGPVSAPAPVVRPAATPVPAPVVEAALPVAPPVVAPPPVTAAPSIAARVVAPEVIAPPVVSFDGPLDLVLPTIYGAEASPSPEAAPQPVVQAPAPLDRYEHLYTMMNEVVRDFLAPHRRYFLQLKIERCGTPEELLELLHDLQTALAKARGEAFASDVIARLRNAAV